MSSPTPRRSPLGAIESAQPPPREAQLSERPFLTHLNLRLDPADSEALAAAHQVLGLQLPLTPNTTTASQELSSRLARTRRMAPANRTPPARLPGHQSPSRPDRPLRLRRRHERRPNRHSPVRPLRPRCPRPRLRARSPSLRLPARRLRPNPARPRPGPAHRRRRHAHLRHHRPPQLRPLRRRLAQRLRPPIRPPLPNIGHRMSEPLQNSPSPSPGQPLPPSPLRERAGVRVAACPTTQAGVRQPGSPYEPFCPLPGGEGRSLPRTRSGGEGRKPGVPSKSRANHAAPSPPPFFPSPGG